MSQSLFDSDVTLNDNIIVSSDRSDQDFSPSNEENLEPTQNSGCCQEDQNENPQTNGEQQNERVGQQQAQSSAQIEGSREVDLPFSNQIPFTKQERPSGML